MIASLGLVAALVALFGGCVPMAEIRASQSGYTRYRASGQLLDYTETILPRCRQLYLGEAYAWGFRFETGALALKQPRLRITYLAAPTGFVRPLWIYASDSDAVFSDTAPAAPVDLSQVLSDPPPPPLPGWVLVGQGDSSLLDGPVDYPLDADLLRAQVGGDGRVLLAVVETSVPQNVNLLILGTPTEPDNPLLVLGDPSPADALETIATTAIAGLSVTRRPGTSGDLPPEALPHAFLHTESATVGIQLWGQESVARTLRLDFVFRDTQTAALAAFEAFSEALRADAAASPRVLPAAIRRAWVSELVVGEHEQRPGEVLIESVVTLASAEG